MTGTSGTPGRNDVLRIIVADDQASVREGLVVLLDLLPDINVVAAGSRAGTSSRFAERPSRVIIPACIGCRAMRQEDGSAPDPDD